MKKVLPLVAGVVGLSTGGVTSVQAQNAEDAGSLLICKFEPIDAAEGKEAGEIYLFVPEQNAEGDMRISYSASRDNFLGDFEFSRIHGDADAKVGEREFIVSTHISGEDNLLLTLGSIKPMKLFKDQFEVLYAVLGWVSDDRPSHAGECVLLEGPVKPVFESYRSEGAA